MLAVAGAIYGITAVLHGSGFLAVYVAGLMLGAGYVLVYRSSRVLNLAQGDLLTLGGYFLFAVASAVNSSRSPQRMRAWPLMT